MKFSEIGKKIENTTGKSDVLFADIENEAFRVLGVWKDEEMGIYRRMPDGIAASVSEPVRGLVKQTAGGRIRFTTNSPYIAIKVKYDDYYRSSHGSLTGKCGIDVYEGKHYIGVFKPNPLDPTTLESVVELDGKSHDLTLNMPHYIRVREVLIGLAEGSEISHAPLYKYDKPVVFYGSSITQGACAARPGMTYENILSREIDFNYINLGFSGNAKAEPEMAEYIAGLDMSAFVYDYEHNTPSLEHLWESHERLFLTVREKHPDIPIIIISAPRYYYEAERSGAVKHTYLSALARGDKNVYFIPGYSFFTDNAVSEYSVDTTHPTVLGFYFMAKKIAPVLKKCLEDSSK